LLEDYAWGPLLIELIFAGGVPTFYFLPGGTMKMNFGNCCWFRVGFDPPHKVVWGDQLIDPLDHNMPFEMIPLN